VPCSPGQRAATRPARSVASTLCWRLNWIGIALALYVFMADSLRTVHEGMEATRTVLPTAFNWSVFVVALALMAAPVADILWGMRPMTPSGGYSLAVRLKTWRSKANDQEIYRF
jgi:hypothetical protein